MSTTCTSCSAVGTLEYDSQLGALACTRCGTVSSSSSSYAYEFLGRVDAEDDYQNGRTYIGGNFDAFGGIGGAGGRNGGKAAWASKAGDHKAVYHSKKQDEFNSFLRRLLSRFQLWESLRDRVRFLFREAKTRIKFKWGRRAEIFAAACLYVAAKEGNKKLWLLELADVVEVKDLYTLTRAIRIVKYECNLPLLADSEPAMFLERILTHLNTLFSSSSSPPLHGGKKKTWSTSNLAWIRSLSLPEVRNLATGLLAFGHDIALTNGRSPEQVACAVVLVALEGVARRPAPVGQDWADELSHFLGCKPFTIQERYREYNKLLADYAPQLPWLAKDEFAVPGEKAKKGRKGKKKELVQYTSDIVQFRRAIEAKKAKDQRVKEEEAAAREKGKGREETAELGLTPLDAEDDGEEEDDQVADAYFQQDFFRDPSAPAGASSRPTAKRARSSSLTGSPPSANFNPLLPVPSSTSTSTAAAAGFYPTRSRIERASKPAHQLTEGPKRPSQYVYVPDTSSEKRLKRIHEVSEGLVASTPSTRRGSTSLSPPPVSVPAPSPFIATTWKSQRPTAPLASHDPANVQIRQLLLAGHDPSSIHAHLHPTSSSSVSSSLALPASSSSNNRLSRLLWTKPAAEITTEELFDDGELESYIRSESDVQAFKRLPKTQAMVRDWAEVSLRAAVAPPRTNAPRRKRNRFFAKCYPVKEGQEGDQEAAGEGGGGGGRKRREGTDTSDSFKPRKKKTKLTSEAKARIEALLAMGDGSDDEDAPVSRSRGRRKEGEDEWRMDFALDAAREEGEEVDSDSHQDGADDDDHVEASSPPSGAGRRGRGRKVTEEPEDNWRAQMGYGGRIEEEEEGYDD